MHYLFVTNRLTQLCDIFNFFHHVNTVILFLLLQLANQTLYCKVRHHALERKEKKKKIPEMGVKDQVQIW